MHLSDEELNHYKAQEVELEISETVRAKLKKAETDVEALTTAMEAIVAMAEAGVTCSEAAMHILRETIVEVGKSAIMKTGTVETGFNADGIPAFILPDLQPIYA
jgi:hypothetical protein